QRSTEILLAVLRALPVVATDVEQHRGPSEVGVVHDGCLVWNGLSTRLGQADGPVCGERHIRAKRAGSHSSILSLVHRSWVGHRGICFSATGGQSFSGNRELGGIAS